MPLDAAQCSHCPHVFRTKFVSPDQTQAFLAGDPGKPINPPLQQPQQSYSQPPQYSAYPRGYSQSPFMDTVTQILRSLPTVVCFLIGFFTNLFAIILMVMYFGYAPTRDTAKGVATVIGFATPMIFWMLFLALTAIRH